ncbi:MAG: class I SAM-dependent methyltransferase [Desulfobacca sp.]|nr:class I SAM-dependent methyltransferase [Desulfobacca sp.]
MIDEGSPVPCRLCGAQKYIPIYYLDDIETVRCQNCGLVQLSRCLASREELTRYYSSKGKDAAPLRSMFDKQKIWRGSKFRLHYFKKYTGLTSGKVLEVGSSEGHFLALLQAQGFEVLGVEPSSIGADKHREKGIPVIESLLEDADLPDSFFDAICLFQVFEHFEEPKQIAHTFYQKLKVGGRLAIEIPDIFSIGAKFEKNPHKLFNKEHICFFSPETLRALLTDVGFKPIFAHHCDYDGFRLPFGKSLKKIFVPLFRPAFKGPLDKILLQEADNYYKTIETPPDCRTTGSSSLATNRLSKDLKKALSAPFDIFFGYLAYRLDRGASLYWIGQKI